jgi:hypothetical protein
VNPFSCAGSFTIKGNYCILKRKVYKTLRNHINELKMGRNSSLISSFPKNIKPVGIYQDKKNSLIKLTNFFDEKHKVFFIKILL